MSLFFHIASWSIAAAISFFLIQAFLIWVISLLITYPKRPESPYLHHFTVVITAYKNMVMCNPLVESFIKSNYPNLDIIIVADQCEINDFHMYSENVRLLVPENPLGSKVRSMAYAAEHLNENTEGVVVMDPDNLAHPDFLFNINQYFHRGYEVVQGIRIAKNKNSSIARSDSLGEFYYNFTDRYLTFKVGSSATISGSGMAVRKDIFFNFLNSRKVNRKLEKGPILGEDKMLQNYTVLNGGRVAFEPNAIIFDEKLISGKQVERQRTRWINTYFENIGDAFKLLFNGFVRFRWNSLILGLVSIKPPLLILVGSALVVSLLCIFVNPAASLTIGASMVIFGLFFIYAAWRSPHSRGVFSSLLGIPKFLFHQLKALLKTRKHRKDFLATENTQNVSIKEMANNKSN